MTNETIAERLERLKNTEGCWVDGQVMVSESDFRFLNEQVQELSVWEETARNYFGTNVSLKADNRLMREALEFYAYNENWWTYPVQGGYASAASVDKGYKARQILKGVSHDKTIET